MKRFWSKVNKNGPIPEHRPELGPCWVWTGATTRGGYGNFRIPGTRNNARAHRYAFYLTHKRWPENMCLHACDNPPCCNPFHLFCGTAKQNVADMIDKGRDVRLKGESHPHAKFTNKDIADIRSSNLRVKDIANKYCVPNAVISAIRLGRIWRHLPGSIQSTIGKRRIGNMNGSAKLNPDKVRVIRKSTLSATDLARRFGVTPALINAIRKRKIWSQVND